MKLLKLKNADVMLDDEDYEWLAPLTNWHLNQNGYVQLVKYIKGTSKHYNGKQVGAKYKTFHMARLIMFAEVGEEVDHIDGNPLNNQKSNLRLCTSQQNKWNQRARRKDGLKGVSTAYRSIINGKYAGSFRSEHLAALMYDFWATEVHGEFANTNFNVVISFTR